MKTLKIILPDQLPTPANSVPHSGAMEAVSPNFCNLRHVSLAMCFKVVVTVAVPIEWA